MWTNVGILFLFVLFFSALGVMNQKEGFEDPTATSQEQKGDILTFQNQLKQITFSTESLNEIQDSISDLTDQTNTLRENVPDGQVQQYAPD